MYIPIYDCYSPELGMSQRMVGGQYYVVQEAKPRGSVGSGMMPRGSYITEYSLSCSFDQQLDRLDTTPSCPNYPHPGVFPQLDVPVFPDRSTSQTDSSIVSDVMNSKNRLRGNRNGLQYWDGWEALDQGLLDDFDSIGELLTLTGMSIGVWIVDNHGFVP